MNPHRLLDQVISGVGRAVIPSHFRTSTTGRTLQEHFAAVSLAVPAPTSVPDHVEVMAETLAGPQLAGFRTVRWVGEDAGTVIHCHGGGELPYDKSARKVFGSGHAFPGNVLVVQSPLHTSRKEFVDGIATMDPWLAMIAVSVELVEQLVSHTAGWAPVVVSGYSLGGFIANLHFLRHGSADVYAPMAAGLDMGSVVIDAAGRRALNDEQSRDIRRALNFPGDLGPAVGSRVFPVLGMHDHINPPARHASAYGNQRVTVWPRGHFTGIMAAGSLWRAHLEECLQTAALLRASS